MFFQPERNGVGHQIGDDFKQLDVAVEVGAGFDRAVDAHRADHFAVVNDRHADEGDMKIVAARFGAVEKFRFQRNIRNDPRRRRRRHRAGDAFAETVTAATDFRVAQPWIASIKVLAVTQRHGPRSSPFHGKESPAPAEKLRNVFFAHHRWLIWVENRI